MSQNSAQSQQKQWKFGKVLGKQLRGVFDGHLLTDCGGAQLFAAVEQRHQMIEGFSNCIPDWRTDQNLVSYSIKHQVAQRILLIGCGYEDAIDSNLKRSDLALSLALAAITDNPNMASQSTICILENSVKQATLKALHRWFIQNYMDRHGDHPPKEIILDFDGSSSPTHGNQEGTAYHGYYETNMYFPLFVYDQHGWLLAAVLRPGAESEDKIIVGELSRIAEALRAKWPKIKITIRADAGVYNPKICDWCEKNGVFYIFRIQSPGHGGGGMRVHSDKAAALAAIEFCKQFGKERHLDSGITKSKLEAGYKKLPKKQRMAKLAQLESRIMRVYHEFNYQSGNSENDKKRWKRARRILTACTHTDWGGERTFFVTNIVGGSAEEIIKQIYNRRGEAELAIRDMKGLKCTRLSCQSFEANQFRLLLHGLSYLFLLCLRRLIPPSVGHLSIASLQKYFVRISAKITETSRELFLHWDSDFPWQRQFFQLLRNIDCMPLTTRC